MKKNLFTILSIVLTTALFTSCQSNQKNDDNVALDTNIVPISTQECYTYIKNRDTATLTFMTSGTVVTGELAYNLFEKDKNKGIIEGDIRGDTLVVDYTFNSEGKESTRQVVLLKQDNQMLEGYGDVEEKNGSTVFKNISQLTFGKSIVFNKVNCN